MKDIIKKSEVQFWFGIITIIVSGAVGFAVLKVSVSKDIQYLAEKIDNLTLKMDDHIAIDSIDHTDIALLKQTQKNVLRFLGLD